MTTYLRGVQNTVPLKSQNWTDFMARHLTYANGAWNWVTECEKRRWGKKKNLFLPASLQRRAETFSSCTGPVLQPSETSSSVTKTDDNIEDNVCFHRTLTCKIWCEMLLSIRRKRNKCHIWWMHVIIKLGYTKQLYNFAHLLKIWIWLMQK